MLLVGTDYPARVGLRVETLGRGHDLDSAFDFDFKGPLRPGTQGTIEAISADAMNCTVRWDNGDANICKCGAGSKDLVVLGSKANALGERAISGPFALEIKAAAPMNAIQPTPTSTTRYVSSMQPRYTPISASTLGLRIFQGQRVDFVVPGGPAHLSQMFERNDEIIAVDGMEVTPETLQDAILGDDVEGSVVTLTIRKLHTGNIFDVQLARVSKHSLQPMMELLEILDHIKKLHSESFQRNIPTEALIDDAFCLIANIMLDRNIADGDALAAARRLLQQRESEIARLESEVAGFQQRMRSTESERGAARERAVARSDDSFEDAREMQALQQPLRESQTTNQQYSAQLNAARQQIKKLEEKVISFEEERDQFTQRAVLEFSRKYAQEKAAAEKSAQDLRKQLGELENREKKRILELEEAREQAANLFARAQRIEIEMHAKNNEEFEMLQKQLADKDAIERCLNEDLEAAKQTITELQMLASGTQVAELEKQICSLKEDLASAHAEKLKVQEELDNAAKQIEALQTKISTLNTTEELTNELQKMKTASQEQANTLQSLKERDAVLSEALQAAQLHIQNLESDREQRIEIAETYMSNMKELKSELEAREESVRLLRVEAQKIQEELESKDSMKQDLNDQLEVLRQQVAKGDSTGSAKVLEKLRSELQQSQKQVGRLEEEQQLSRAAIEEARKVLMECGRLRSELKEKNDFLKEAQSLVLDQESTIRMLQTTIQENESQGNIKLKDYEDEVSKLKITIEDLKAQWQQIHEKQLKQHAEEIEKLKADRLGRSNVEAERPGRSNMERATAPTTQDAFEKQKAPKLLSAPMSRSKLPNVSNVVTLGVKISENHPHYVQDISDLMDENGKIINNEINIGDELIKVDATETKILSGEEFRKLIDGEAGTLVLLQFRDLVTNNFYKINAQRHFPVSASTFPGRSFDS